MHTCQNILLEIVNSSTPVSAIKVDSILRKIDRMKDDGKLSQKEREKINRDLDRLDRDITREKRDDDHGRRGDDSRRR